MVFILKDLLLFALLLMNCAQVAGATATDEDYKKRPAVSKPMSAAEAKALNDREFYKDLLGYESQNTGPIGEEEQDTIDKQMKEAFTAFFDQLKDPTAP